LAPDEIRRRRDVAISATYGSFAGWQGARAARSYHERRPRRGDADETRS